MIKPCDLSFVGSILFKEYPSTLVYSYKNKSPYIVEWVDISDNGVDKYFIYNTSKDNLKKYFDRKISHKELILSAENGIVVFFEGKIEHPKNISMSGIEFINKEYLPSQESFFEKNDSDDIDKIISYFELNKKSN